MFANNSFIKQLQKSNWQWLGETLKQACGFLLPPLYCSSGVKVAFVLVILHLTKYSGASAEPALNQCIW